MWFYLLTPYDSLSGSYSSLEGKKTNKEGDLLSHDLKLRNPYVYIHIIA